MGAKIPKHPLTNAAILDAIKEFQRDDAPWEQGRLFSLVYHHAEDHIGPLLERAYLSSFSLNALGLRAFPSLAHMEREIVEMTAHLLGATDAFGSFTSGGSESNFLAVKTARDRSRVLKAGVGTPELILPMSAHPSFNKAAHYLGVNAIRTPIGADQKANIEATRRAITRNTMLLVGSAPSWPHGIVDPIEDLAELAREHDVMLHVDACVGGFVLPFARLLNRHVPAFDLSVDGVTSISADIHKFGYAPKGASVVLYRSAEMYDFQPFAFDDWTGGLYSVPTFAGSRSGGPIAAAWTALNGLGEAGYVGLTDRCLRTAARFIEGITSVDGLYIVGDPQYNLFAFGSHHLDISAIWRAMLLRGWRMGLQGKPPSDIHLTVSPAHDRVVDDFIGDLHRAIDQVAAGEISGSETTARYA